MKPRIVTYGLDQTNEARLYYGQDVLTTLRQLPDESVQMAATSPPYWGLRDYGGEPPTWADGWTGHLGLEPTPKLFVQHLVEVFREVRRVLKDDGVLWLNLGDTYFGSSTSSSNHTNFGRDMVAEGRWPTDKSAGGDNPNHKNTAWPAARDNPEDYWHLKPKDMVGIPWRVALALQEDGWYLRSDVVWSKPSCMPESVTDRPTRSHEYVFLLAKSRSYFYDADAIREPHKATSVARVARTHHSEGHKWAEGPGGQTLANDLTNALHTNGRNKRTVWSISPKNYPGAHFATWPPELAEIMVKAGSKPGDVVLDPFSGSATTGEVALSLGRNYIGCDLQPDYLELAVARLEGRQAPKKIVKESKSLFDDLFPEG